MGASWTCLVVSMALVGCVSGGRPDDAVPVVGPVDARASGEVDGSRPWLPPDPPGPMAPFAFRIPLLNGDGTVGAYIEVDAGFHFYDYIAGGPRPTEHRVRFDDDWALRDLHSGQVYFRLRPSDGALVETGDLGYVEQDLHCHFNDGAALGCHHDDGGTGVDFVLSVRGDRIVGRHLGVGPGDAPLSMAVVEPAPENDDQRRRVLFIWASYMIQRDTASHDGDTGFFDGPD